MYIIANYEWNWKCENTYSTFNDAFMKYQILNDNTNVIEYINFDSGNKEVVWDSRWSNIILNKEI